MSYEQCGYKYSGILLKGVGETIKDEAREQRSAFLNMLLDTLGASLLGNRLAGKGIIREEEETARAGYGSKISSIKRYSLKKI